MFRRLTVIASHGLMSEGLANTFAMLAGNSEEVIAISGYVGEVPLEKQVEAVFAGLDADTEVLVFTDLLGGSVNRAFLPYLSREHTHLIAGMFLGIVLDLALRPPEYLTAEDIDEALVQAKQSIVSMRTFVSTVGEVDE